MIALYLLIPIYAFLGAAIKFIDQAYDEGLYPRWSAKVLAVLSGVVMGLAMFLDPPFSTAFFLSMVISLVLAGKIDNGAFLVGSIISLMCFGTLAALYGTTILLVPVIVFIVAGIIDEIGDKYAHDHQLDFGLDGFLHYRPFSDMALVLLIVMMPFDLAYLVPYFSFTLAYIWMTRRDDLRMVESIHDLLRKAYRLLP